MAGRVTRRDEKFELVKGYLDTPYKLRLPLPQFRKENRIRRDEYIMLKRDVEEFGLEVAKKRTDDARKWMEDSLSGQEAGESEDDSLESDPEGWWKNRVVELYQAVFSSAKKGNAQSQKLAAQLSGMLVEKQEVKIGLTADEIARRNFEAERLLRDGGFNIRRADGLAVADVEGELSVLHGEPCVDNQPEHGSEG